MAEENTLKKDLEQAVEHLEQNRLEEAGHKLKQIGIKSYYASQDSEMDQKWLDFHKTMNVIGHAFLKKDESTRRHLESHRKQALDILEDLLNGKQSPLAQEAYSFNKHDHIAALKDRIDFLEKELEKSQEQVLQLKKERRQKH